jgi:hypothetical protein
VTTLLDDLTEICARVSAAKPEFASELADLRCALTVICE